MPRSGTRGLLRQSGAQSATERSAEQSHDDEIDRIHQRGIAVQIGANSRQNSSSGNVVGLLAFELAVQGNEDIRDSHFKHSLVSR